MRLTYFTHNIQWPETFNHPDVIVEIPFEFGYVNYFPYYKEYEPVVYSDKIKKVLITNRGISISAEEALDDQEKTLIVKHH